MAKNVSGDTRANKATKIKAVARATAKAGADQDNVEVNVTLKQVVVGFVIACFASILLAFYAADFFLFFIPSHKYEPYTPKEVFFVMDATSKNEVNYEIYYTVAKETWYGEDKVLRFKGKKGSHTYVMKLPVERIYNLRVDFGQMPGALWINDIRLLGLQSIWLSNFKNYHFNQIENHSITSKGQLFLESREKDPFMIYNDNL